MQFVSQSFIAKDANEKRRAEVKNDGQEMALILS